MLKFVRHIFLYSLTSIHLFNEVILDGLRRAHIGFSFASLLRNEEDKEEFKNDSEMFSNTAKAIDDLLETTMEEREGWLELQDDFEKILK